MINEDPIKRIENKKYYIFFILIVIVIIYWIGFEIYTHILLMNTTSNGNELVSVKEENNLSKYVEDVNNIEKINYDKETKEYILKIGENKVLQEYGIVVALNKYKNNEKNSYFLNTKYYENNNEYVISQKNESYNVFISNNYDLVITEWLTDGIKFKIIYTAITFNDFAYISEDESCTFASFNNLNISLKHIIDLRENILDYESKIECKILVKYNEKEEEYNLKLGEQNKIVIDNYILQISGHEINSLKITICELKDYNSDYLYSTEKYFFQGYSFSVGSDKLQNGIEIELDEIIENGKYKFKIDDKIEEKIIILDVLNNNIEKINDNLEIRIISANEKGISLKILYN